MRLRGDGYEMRKTAYHCPTAVGRKNLTIVERVLRFDINANPCVAGLGYEDLYQEGCVWLCNAALTFDPARGSFASYARRVVQNGLIGYCRNVLGQYRRTVSLGDLEPAVLAALKLKTQSQVIQSAKRPCCLSLQNLNTAA